VEAIRLVSLTIEDFLYRLFVEVSQLLFALPNGVVLWQVVSESQNFACGTVYRVRRFYILKEPREVVVDG